METKPIIDIQYRGTRIRGLLGDITKQESEAIVNAANSTLLGGGGVDGAIHRAGGPQILEECMEIRKSQGTCATGEAVITSGGYLKARYVIHAVGPIWQEGDKDAEVLLANAYRNSLELAYKHGIKSISFPSISTGAYRYPIRKASLIALETTKAMIDKIKFEEVAFVLFSKEDFEIYRERIHDLF